MNVRLLRVPLPGFGLESVNVYLVGSSLVDVGLYSGASIHALIRGLKDNGLRVCDITSVIVTHFHVDHLSMLPVVLDASDAKAYLGWRDLEILREGADRFVLEVLELFRVNGVPDSEIKAIVGGHPIMRFSDLYLRVLPQLDIKPLREGDIVELGDLRFRVLETPGHTPGSIVLVNEGLGVAFVGDVLLNDITPHVILHRRSEDPLREHLESLRRIAGLNLRIAYPGHRTVVENPARRARELIEFHEERLREILGLAGEGRTAYEIAVRVKWRVRYGDWSEFPPVERFFAVGETLAHLEHLRRRKLVDYYEKGNTMYWYKLQ